ncbi:DAR GTPase 2, mitochondrial [Ananas comosus]|uniref:DAR GTPase 2, mitochondrial n=1 Tax=Ananas comosus TaxID=4615 RepID=A0A199VJR7_ANACO|nr:DAR GTPase 2, mitochondrial [Ananas comosus]
MAAASSSFSRRLGAAVRELGMKGAAEGWYGAHMAAAERAILERAPLVDLVLEVRDARIPATSAFESLGRWSGSNKHMIALNKVDLADASSTEKWVKHIGKQNCVCRGVNAHNKGSIKELLSTVRSRIKELKGGESSYTATVMLVGIPNVGKSAIANSMHQIGRIGAMEKGKLKHAMVSPLPGETRDISSYKLKSTLSSTNATVWYSKSVSFQIASHPNIYVLDTPGILSPKIANDDFGSKLALTGAIKDSLLGEYKLSQYFLSLLNSSEEHKHWGNLKYSTDEKIPLGTKDEQRRRRRYPSDHTQDFIVKDVRRTLFMTISSFKGSLEKGKEMEKLVESQFMALHEAFRVSYESTEDRNKAVGAKLLNLYRTGRVGRYTLDAFPELWRSSPDQFGKMTRPMKRQIPQPIAIV